MAMQLQTKRLVTATDMAAKFSVSIRTVYRDIRALEQAGVPIITEDGKGYSLMEGFRLPPVMFTESEASALVTAEQLVIKSKDSSLKEEYQSATDKIKAVLKYAIKEKVELLSSRIAVSPAALQGHTTSSLTLIQNALTSYKVLEITYQSGNSREDTKRKVEPFALYFSLEENWLMIAYCRLRKDYRMFRLDRISSIRLLEMNFKPHDLTLADYLAEKKKKFANP